MFRHRKPERKAESSATLTMGGAVGAGYACAIASVAPIAPIVRRRATRGRRTGRTGIMRRLGEGVRTAGALPDRALQELDAMREIVLGDDEWGEQPDGVIPRPD